MKKCLKWLGIVVGALVALVLLLAVVATRPAFITSVIVPRVGKSIQSDIRIGTLQFAPFSRVQAEGIQVGSGDMPLLRSDLMRVRYGLWDTLCGRVRVDEVRLEGTTIHVIRRADGTMNLPVFPPSEKDDKDEDDEDENAPQDLRVADVRLSGVSLIYEQQAGPAQAPVSVRLSDLTLDVPELASGKEAVLKLGGRLDDLTVGGIAGARGTLSGECRLGLDSALAVTLVDLAVRIRFERGTANAIDLAGREIRLEVQANADADGMTIRRAAVTELSGERPEATVAISGRAQRAPADITLEVVAEPIEAAVFSIAGAFVGDLSFGEPSGTYHAKVRVQSPQPLHRAMERNLQQPWTVAASGRLELRSLAPASKTWGLKDITPFDASVEHDVAWSSQTGCIEVRTLAVRAGTAGREMLSAELSQPLVLSLTDAAAAVAQAEAVLTLKARGLALNAANPFLPADLPLHVASGNLDADATVTVARQGAAVQMAAAVKVTDAALAGASGKPGTPFSLEAAVKASIADRRRIETESLSAALRPEGGNVAMVQAAGRFDLDRGGDGTVSFGGVREALLSVLPAAVAAALPLERFAVDGEVRWQAGKGFTPLTADAKVNVAEVRLRGQEGSDDLSAALAVQADLKPDEAALRAATVRVAIAGQPVLLAALDGAVGLAKAAGQPKVLALRSDLIDVDRILAFAKPMLGAPATAGAPAAPTPAPVRAPSPATTPAAAPALPPLNTAVSLDLKRIVYHGQQVAVTGTATLADAAELKSLTLKLPSGDITLDAALKPEGQDWRARLGVLASGEALGELAAWAGKTLPAAAVKGTSLSLRVDGAAAPDGARVRMDTVEIKIAEVGKSPMLTVNLTRPLALSRPADGSLSWTDASLAIAATRFPVTLLNPVLPPSAGVRLDGGVLDATLNVDLKAEGLEAAVGGSFGLADLAGARGEQTFTALRLEGGVQGVVRGKDRVSVSKLTGTVTADGTKAVAFAVNGEWDRAKGGSGNLDVTVDVPVALKVAGLGGPQVARVKTLTLNVSGKAQVPPENGPIRTDLTLAADGIVLADSAGAALPPWGLQVAAVAALHQDHVALDALSVRAKTSEKTLADLGLSGTVALPPMKGRSELKLTGEMLDLTGLMGVTVGAKAEKKAEAEEGKKPGERQPGSEPGPFDTGEAVAVVTVDLKNVTYGEIKSDLGCTVRLQDSVVTVDPIKSTICGAAATGNAKANLAVPGFDYAVKLAVGGLDTAPFVKTFAPELASSIQGTVSGLTVDIAGQGVTMPSLRRTLSGRFETEARDLVLQGLPGQSALATRWAVPELEKIQITQAELKTRIQDGNVLVDSFKETAAEHTVNATGTVGLDERLSLDVGFGVGGSLLTRLRALPNTQRFLSFFTTQGDYLASPVPISLAGTVRKPKFEVDRFLAELAKASAKTVLQQAVQEKAGDVLGGLLKGAVGTETGSSSKGANGTETGSQKRAPGVDVGTLLKGLGVAVPGATGNQQAPRPGR